MTTPIGKRTTSPAFQFYPKDFLSSRKVDAMSMAERGIYITLLARCWDEDGLPTDNSELARAVKMTPGQFERLWQRSAVRLCFYERGGKLHNERLDRERKIQSEFRRKQKEKADKRWLSRGIPPAVPREEPGTPGTEPGNAPLPQSSSSSASAIRNPQSAETRTPRAPIAGVRNEHRNHAHCGRVCLPAFLFSEFVRRRGGADPDRVIRDWALHVEKAWQNDPREPGEPIAFWRARYDESWPSAEPPKPSGLRQKPAWAR